MEAETLDLRGQLCECERHVIRKAGYEFCWECRKEQDEWDKEWFFDQDGRIHSMANWHDLYG
jgi:hypothetical protein